jgi:hypothetical protein
MANPQPTDSHLRIAHSITEAIMLREFTKRQRAILDLILRLSWGCGKKTAYVPRQQDFEIIGITKGHIRRELDFLIVSKVIFRDDNFYQFNKDFDEWQISRVNPYEPDRLFELIKLNLSISYQNGNYSEDLNIPDAKLLPKREPKSYQKGNFSTPELATPIKKNRKYIYISDNNGGKKITTDISNETLIDERWTVETCKAIAEGKLSATRINRLIACERLKELGVEYEA